MNPGGFSQRTAKLQTSPAIAAMPWAGGWWTYCKQQERVSSLITESSKGEGDLWEQRGLPREAGQERNQRQPSNSLLWSQIRHITLTNSSSASHPQHISSSFTQTWRLILHCCGISDTVITCVWCSTERALIPAMKFMLLTQETMRQADRCWEEHRESCTGFAHSFIPLVAGRTCHRRTNSHKWGITLDCLFASVIITLDGRQGAAAFAWSRATFWLLGNSKPWKINKTCQLHPAAWLKSIYLVWSNWTPRNCCD